LQHVSGYGLLLQRFVEPPRELFDDFLRIGRARGFGAGGLAMPGRAKLAFQPSGL
jgi:hypothetical protein